MATTGERIAALEPVVARAAEDAEVARDRAGKLHIDHAETKLRVARLEFVQREHDERIELQEREMAQYRTSAERLAGAVERLAGSVGNVTPHPPAAQQVKESWASAKRKTKVKMLATVIAVLSAPELIKQIAEAIGRLLGRIH